MRGRAARFVVLLCIALFTSAHIGSPDAWYNGAAGPYHVVVHVKAPAVVPGIAIVNINPKEPVDLVTAFVNKFDAIEGGPPPDVAKPVDGTPGWYRTQLWVMDPGSNSVTVTLTGAQGKGSVVIPLVAVASRRLAFNGLLTTVLGAAGLVLVAGVLTIIGATVRESVLLPGTVPDGTRRKRARFAMVRGAVVIVAVVGGLAFWWNAEDSAFAQNMFKPLAASAQVEFVAGVGTQLQLRITDSLWTQRGVVRRVDPRSAGSEFTTLIDDHNKLMHMFVIAEDGSGTFVHVHPTTNDSVTFATLLPRLPDGRYRVYADILHATGFAQTLAAEVTLPGIGRGEEPGLVDSGSVKMKEGVLRADPDAGWIVAGKPSTGKSFLLEDQSVLTWTGFRESIVAGVPADLSFQVSSPSGDSATLEPYLGMLGHAVVMRDDGAVFIHLHPMGTVSMAAQQLLTHGKDSVHQMPMADETRSESTLEKGTPGATLNFPYAFPTAGNYTVWVQIKRHGKVQTGIFRTTVTAGVN